MKGSPPSFRVFPESEISFNYVPKKYLNSNIQLTSASDQPLAFKIKTNVPVCYLVKPHIGFLPPRASVNVAITMQPTDYNPQNAAISDKFLINIAPLQSDTDVAALSDPARFQQIWDSVPKNLVQSHKLKVALKFEAGSANTSIIDRAPDDASRSMLADSKTSNQRSNQIDDFTMQQRGGESGKSSVMHSFVVDNSISKETSSGQTVLPRFANEQVVTTSQGQAQATGARGENANVGPQGFEEKIRMLERKIEEMTNEKKVLNQRCQELTGKAEEQQRLLFGLSEENTRLKSELGNLKSSTFKGKSATAGGQSESGTYQSWHVLLAALIALIIGAYLSSSK